MGKLIILFICTLMFCSCDFLTNTYTFENLSSETIIVNITGAESFVLTTKSTNNSHIHSTRLESDDVFTYTPMSVS